METLPEEEFKQSVTELIHRFTGESQPEQPCYQRHIGFAHQDNVSGDSCDSMASYIVTLLKVAFEERMRRKDKMLKT